MTGAMCSTRSSGNGSVAIMKASTGTTRRRSHWAALGVYPLVATITWPARTVPRGVDTRKPLPERSMVCTGQWPMMRAPSRAARSSRPAW